MTLSKYEVAAVGENGMVFVTVTLIDGSTFGQWIRTGTQAEMDGQVNDAVTRVAAAESLAAAPAIGTVRTASDVQVSVAAPAA